MKNFLDEIPGQQQVKTILNGFLKSKNIPHALLFSGINGTGKEYTATKFAQSVASQTKKSNINRVLSQIELLSEPYVKYIIPLPRGKGETDSTSPTEKLTNDEIELLREQLSLKIQNPFHKIYLPKANNIKISSIRDIKKFLSLDFSEIERRFIIINDAHLMNEEAQNALLKNLEEPPENVIFILCTSQVSKLRRTIISRCWRINFDPLAEKDIAYILKKFFESEEQVIKAVTPFANGSVQTALQLIEMDIFRLKEKTIAILRFSFGRKFSSAFDELNSVLGDQPIQNYPAVVKMMIIWLNDLLKNKYNLKDFFFNDYRETLEKFNSKFPETDLNSISVKLDKLISLTRNNINPNLLSANLIFELSAVTAKS
ncbi:MAG: AAA family ATPase [Ignavibacteria bacterium]|nr:AAA family ATPase [Ignavibacteria bacterium]MBT8381786.1 AAA family ATPase [Ignavibacteria bacterium]MBT8392622.1 AAA family ATPase [Ignavibacteria bacterium]NNJ51619.1 AAA family ATPase [Ignavibacteriaceae bacterium]NNL20293.1 AAA family ATPase [Ignavibacteriaceae bacterium]